MDATEWDTRYAGSPRLWSAGPNRFVEERLAGSPPGTALDLACGEGRNAVWLAERGWTVTAVDFSPVALARARESGAEVEWICADAARWAPAVEGFDLILIAYLQIPAAELARLLERVVKWVAPGGELFLVGHDLDNLAGGHGGPSDPDLHWSVGALSAEVAPLEPFEAAQVRRPVDTPDGPVEAIDTLVRARRPRAG